MSLDVAKLEKVRELANGVTQARCPACAEGGGDRKGEHLRIYPDGRYGCCVHPKDAPHRKRIFALAGASGAGRSGRAGSRGQFTVKVGAAARAAEPARSVKGALTDCGMGKADRGMPSPLAPLPSDERGELVAGVRTLRTGEGNSEYERSLCSGGEAEAAANSRTLRTPFSNPRACAREDPDNAYIYKDSENGVLSVLGEKDQSDGRDQRDGGRRTLPYLMADGTLVIPFGAPERYLWWKHGQSAEETRAELLERQELNASPF